MSIPAIGVRSELLRLGVDADGSAEVPADHGRAGWFGPGGRPGATGPTVLLGHVDPTSGPAVFFRLRDLRRGDAVDVTTADGTVARYRVDRSEAVAEDRLPTFAVFGATAEDVLRLVTCTGAVDRGGAATPTTSSCTRCGPDPVASAERARSAQRARSANLAEPVTARGRSSMVEP